MKYFIGVLVILFFFIVGGLLFFNRDKAPEVLSDAKDNSLAQHAENSDSSVSWTKKGKIVANEDFYAVRVTVTSSQRTIEVLKGYNETLVRRETYPNNKEAYSVLLKALDNLGYSKTKDATYSEAEGACPTGYRYLYKLESSMETPVDSWSTSCSTRDGTFDGTASTVRRLFQEQISDFNEITKPAKF